jgi:GGDEF domain-containing protein
MDINNFKQFNSLGLDFGDNVLASVGEHIAVVCEILGARGYRIGGDEFVMVMKRSALDDLPDMSSIANLQTIEGLAKFANALLCTLGNDIRPITVRNTRVQPSLSIGLSFPSDSDESIMRVFGRANIALSIAKLEGKRQGHSFRIYDDSMSTGPQKGIELRQTCTHCGSTIQIVVHPDWTNTRPPEPLCPICTEPLKELELQTQDVTRSLDIVGPLFPDALPSSPSNHPSP